MLPARVLPHTLTIITPADAIDAYGNTVENWDAAASRTIAAYVRPLAGRTDEKADVGRDVSEKAWQVHTNDTTVTAFDRAVWQGVTYEVDGDSLTWPSAPGGRLSMTKFQLRRVAG